ncbi:hypothetical protein MLD38_018398 [Melastoma candidum]|uniref:Uncharacterized protein n=1 Tax=Melastoma candidum TaxID=119954 RepID=A0ACB9QWU4_9MYRT|nr:hypothetical protein MLD38_018398 [Melastoma candidum]
MICGRNLSDLMPVDGALTLALVRLASDVNPPYPCAAHFCSERYTICCRIRLLQNRLNVSPANDEKWVPGMGAIHESFSRKFLALCPHLRDDLFMGRINLQDVNTTLSGNWMGIKNARTDDRMVSVAECDARKHLVISASFFGRMLAVASLAKIAGRALQPVYRTGMGVSAWGWPWHSFVQQKYRCVDQYDCRSIRLIMAMDTKLCVNVDYVTLNWSRERLETNKNYS